MADIVTMTVTDQHGQDGSRPEDRKKRGTCFPALGGTSKGQMVSPYRFYAVMEGMENPPEEKRATAVQTVHLVMPLGGDESGLYRFPRLGERILAAERHSSKGTEYFLMGYLPSETGDFRFQPAGEEDQTRQEVLDRDGLVLRYKKRGTNRKGDSHSEIGFYRRLSEWPEYGESDREMADPSYPDMDDLCLRSGGDLHARSRNLHQVQAGRVELLADCEGVDRTGGKSRAPLDGEGDDSTLYRGDVHVRAAQRIVLKAGQEVRIEVGRSALILRDDGITMTTRKTRKNAASSWDTVLSLTPRDGVTLFGQKVDIGAAYDFSLRESTGGAIYSLGGVMRLSARDFLAQSYSQFGFKANRGDVTRMYNRNLQAMQKGQGDMPSFTAMLPSLTALFENINWGYYAAGGNQADPVGDYVNYCGTLLQILQATYTLRDLTMPAELREAGGRDELNIAAMADEYGYVQQMLDYIEAAGAPDRAMHNSFLHLTTGADAVLSGYETKRLSINTTDGSIPLAGLNPSLTKKETERLQKENAADKVMRELLKGQEGRREEKTLWAMDRPSEDLHRAWGI